ncbi:hypothetical protein [Mycolicibacterium elephantis]
MTTKYPDDSAIIDIPLPPAAILANDWDHGRRIFEGETRELAHDSSNTPVQVWTFGYQADDGRIIGSQCAGDLDAGISVSGLCWEEPLSAETARKLADLLVTAADEVERWAR